MDTAAGVPSAYDSSSSSEGDAGGRDGGDYCGGDGCAGPGGGGGSNVASQVRARMRSARLHQLNQRPSSSSRSRLPTAQPAPQPQLQGMEDKGPASPPPAAAAAPTHAAAPAGAHAAAGSDAAAPAAAPAADWDAGGAGARDDALGPPPPGPPPVGEDVARAVELYRQEAEVRVACGVGFLGAGARGSKEWIWT